MCVGGGIKRTSLDLRDLCRFLPFFLWRFLESLEECLDFLEDFDLCRLCLLWNARGGEGGKAGELR